MNKKLHFFKIISCLIILGVFFINFSFAAGIDDNAILGDVAAILEPALKILYVITRPLLFIAGKAMDNSLVYGEILQLDVSLWQIRNMIKNFANFFLAFWVLYEIIKGYFSFDGASNFGDIIKKTLIAGILIQLSWFMVGAVLDIATIATVSIGGLPLTLTAQSSVAQSIRDKNILMPVTTLNLDTTPLSAEGLKDFTVFHRYKGTTKDINLAPCFITGAAGQKTIQDYDAMKAEYKNAYNFTDNSKSDYIDQFVCIGPGTMPLFFGVGTVSRNFTPANIQVLGNRAKDYLTANGGQGTTLGNIIERSQGLVGPFFTIYGSLLDFGTLNFVENGSAAKLTMQFLLKSVIAIALILPLIVLAIGMMIRVGVLWLVIAFSPFIIIKHVFALDDTGGKMDEYISINGLLGLIFLPVYAVFGLSLSIIFISAIQDSTTQTRGDTQQTVLERGFGVRYENNCLIPGDSGKFTEMCINVGDLSTGYDIFTNFFSRLVVNLLSIGLLRTVVFMTLQASAVTKRLADQFSKFGSSLIQNAPIIPLGKTLGNTSIKGLASLPEGISNEVTRSLNQSSDAGTEKLKRTFYGDPRNESQKYEEELTALKEKQGTQQQMLNKINAVRRASRKTEFKDYDEVVTNNDPEIAAIIPNIGELNGGELNAALDKKHKPKTDKILRAKKPLSKEEFDELSTQTSPQWRTKNAGTLNQGVIFDPISLKVKKIITEPDGKLSIGDEITDQDTIFTSIKDSIDTMIIGSEYLKDEGIRGISEPTLSAIQKATDTDPLKFNMKAPLRDRIKRVYNQRNADNDNKIENNPYKVQHDYITRPINTPTPGGNGGKPPTK